MSTEHIASVSFGKDSLCMLLKLIEEGYPLTEVIFYDTGMEFRAIYETRDKVLPLLEQNNIKYTELHPKNSFLYDMLERPVTSKKGGIRYGYSWCGGRLRWGTMQKNKVIRNYLKQKSDYIEYVGIAHDEMERTKKNTDLHKRFPLVEWKTPEGEALTYCYKRGYWWEENGRPLYSILSRVSCWCCANKNLKELRGYYHYLTEYWEKLKYIEERTYLPFRSNGQSIFDLEERFKRES